MFIGFPDIKRSEMVYRGTCWPAPFDMMLQLRPKSNKKIYDDSEIMRLPYQTPKNARRQKHSTEKRTAKTWDIMTPGPDERVI